MMHLTTKNMPNNGHSISDDNLLVHALIRRQLQTMDDIQQCRQTLQKTNGWFRLLQYASEET